MQNIEPNSIYMQHLPISHEPLGVILPIAKYSLSDKLYPLDKCEVIWTDRFNHIQNLQTLGGE